MAGLAPGTLQPASSIVKRGWERQDSEVAASSSNGVRYARLQSISHCTLHVIAMLDCYASSMLPARLARLCKK
jgi:hypothetical protein